MQAIAMISLLLKGEGVCVRTLGGMEEFCNALQFSDYNPYHEANDTIDLFTTTFPYKLLQDDRAVSSTDLNLSPDMNTDQFATYGPPPITSVNSGRYNSGEDIQSMAAVGWYPFVSSVRSKDKPFENYTGNFILNCLNSGGDLFPSLDDPQETMNLMKKTELVSIFTGKGAITNNLESFRLYNEEVQPFGCRSTLTCQWLKEQKIKSYYSACLTLTSTYDGGLLSLDGTNPSHNALPILEPKSNFSTDVSHVREEKDLILMVDVVDTSVVPKSVRDRARHLSADIPKVYPRDATPYSEKIRYCYRLLSQYKNYAKVVSDLM
jgi:hypothetical protein